MNETERRNRDFSKGPAWDDATNRWLIEVRYPDGRRLRKRLKRERDALRLWTTEQAKLESGTWDPQRARKVTLGVALEEYRAYSRVQHRSHTTYVSASLTQWEKHLGSQTPLARITSSQIEAFKLYRVQKVSRSTADKDLAVLKAFFNWAIAHQMAVANPVRAVKLYHDDNTRLRYLTTAEYDRLLAAARTVDTSLYLEEKIILAVHTGLRRGSLFHLRWDQVDLENRLLRIPRTKSGRPLALPLNARALEALRRLNADRSPESTYVFPHIGGPQKGQPVRDIKNGFHTALERAGIEHLTWHDLRHTFASWLVMRGASLRSVADLLGHQSLKMTMRYAHLSPAFLAAEVALLDPAEPAKQPRRLKTKKARKGQGARSADPAQAKVPDFVRKSGSSGWIRTSNPPVNSRMLCH
jgi:integrase